MFQIKIAIIIIGGALAFFGVREAIVSWGASSDPIPTDLAKLEAGTKPADNHVIIGKHVAVYPQVVFSYETSRYGSKLATETSKVNYAYYPILSANHPFIVKLDSLIREYGSVENIPQDVAKPQIDKVAVLVKTTKFATVGAIPKTIDDEESVKGLIINDIDSLDGDEERLVREGLPNVDVSKVLILELDREPASAFKSIGLIVGGILLILLGIGLFFYRGKQNVQYSPHRAEDD